MDIQNYIEKKLLKCWSTQTSSKYSKENPYAGQCSVTAIIINEFFGGEILKTKVNNQWHFYNCINNKRVDFTKKQFECEPDYQDILSSIIEAFTDTNVEKYHTLKNLLIRELNN